jgi:hypothetical protein
MKPTFWGVVLWLAMLGVGIILAGLSMAACASSFRFRS